MAREIQKKAGVSGNSVAGKSFQIFTVSEELLAKVVEAVQAGEKEARSSGNIQSFEVFCHGFRANISLGRIMVVPAKVCSDRKNFPTALLHGAIVRVFGTGGEEVSDLIEKKIGDSEFDEYSQADFDTLKEELFTDKKTGEEASLVVFAPNWMNSREYICFHFSKDSEQLKNDLRHQVFSAYYNSAVSSAFNALMTNVDTTKVDVTDVTPKLSYPFLSENPLKEFPRLDKQAGWKKATILLNKKTADDVTKQTLDPQELDVFDSLNQALENSLLPEADGAQGEEGFTAPEAHPGVPREASAEAFGGKQAPPFGSKEKEKDKKESSAKIAHIDANGVCPGCKKAGTDCACAGCTCKTADEGTETTPKTHGFGPCTECGSPTSSKIVKDGKTYYGHKPGCSHAKAASAKVAYVSHCPGHTNSKGEKAEWCIKQHNTGKILESFKSEGAAKEGLKNMESHKGSKNAADDEVITTNPLAPHETPFTNVGPGTSAAEAQEAMAPAAKESLEDAVKQNEDKARGPIGIAIDETGVPRRKEEEAKAASKRTEECPGCGKTRVVNNAGMCRDCAKSKSEAEKSASNPSTRSRPAAHPETLRVDPTRLSSAYSAAYNGGFVDKHAMPPQKVRNAMAEVGDNSKPAPHAAHDHAKQIEAGAYGDDPLNRRANEKWGGAEVGTKRSNKEVMASYIADVVATEIDESSDAMSRNAKQARAKKESLLDKFRPKMAVELDIDSIWDAITEDMGPAPLVDVDTDPSNPAPSNTEGESQSTPSDAQEEPRSGTRPNKRDVEDLPEAFRSPEPEEEKSLSDSEADAQEDSMPHADEDVKESSWNVDAKYADLVQEVADEIESEEALPRQRVNCDQCQMLSIQGVPCHEQGCPNQGARWNSDSGNWIGQRECFECGSKVDEGDPCCSAEEYRDGMDEQVEEETRMASAKTAAASEELKKKLNPRRFPGMSGKMAAIVGYILGENYTDPSITEMAITSDGFVMAQQSGDVGMNDMVGSESDLRRNWKTLLSVAGLEDQEKNEANALYSSRIRSYQHVEASAKKADTADNEYDIDAAADPTSKETGPSATVECHKDTDAERSKGTDRPKPEQGADIKQAKEKKADTADNPFNMENDGKGAPENKKVVQKADTTGPTPDNTKQANQNKGVKQTVGEKHDHGIEGDVAQAKSETTSPDTVDKDIPQKTVSVLDAGKRKNAAANLKCYDNGGKTMDRYTVVFMDEPMGGGLYAAVGASGDVTSPQGFYQHSDALPGKHLGKEVRFEQLPQDLQERINYELSEEDAPNDPKGYSKRVSELEAEGMTTSDAQAAADAEFAKKGSKTALHFMNEYDIDEAVNLLGNDPVLGKAARFLKEFKDQVNGHSDGWAYWKAPVAAAGQLMTLIEQGMNAKRGRSFPETSPLINDKSIAKAMGPIKSFMTRRGLAAGMEMPKLAADISGDISEAKAELTYDKAAIADEPMATQTESVGEAGERKNSADISGDMAEADAAIDFDKALIADESQAEDTVNPEHFAGEEEKTACGADQPEEVAFDFGAGDLADIVVTEDVDESGN